MRPKPALLAYYARADAFKFAVGTVRCAVRAAYQRRNRMPKMIVPPAVRGRGHRSAMSLPVLAPLFLNLDASAVALYACALCFFGTIMFGKLSFHRRQIFPGRAAFTSTLETE
jgi:hypothetical protein